MTLIKSKINFSAWLKSTIYISVVGGIILFSKPAASATFSSNFRSSPTLTTFSIGNTGFDGGMTSIELPEGQEWDAVVNIVETQGSLRNDDELLVTVLLQHVMAPHPGDNSLGRQLRLVFNLDAGNTERNQIVIRRNATPVRLPGERNHFDTVEGVLTASITPRLGGNDINSWTLDVTGEHSVPEPLTMLGAATALGYGAFFKRKYCENKKS